MVKKKDKDKELKKPKMSKYAIQFAKIQPQKPGTYPKNVFLSTRWGE